MASISGVELYKGSRYHVTAGPVNRDLGVQQQVRSVIYRGAHRMQAVTYLVFEGPVYHVLIEPQDVRLLELVKVRVW